MSHLETEMCGVSLIISVYSAVVTDAIGIYTTYIALNALSPLDIPDEIRQRVEGSAFQREYFLCVFTYIVMSVCFDNNNGYTHWKFW